MIKNEAKKLGLINISGDKRRIKFEYESRDTYSLEDIQVLSSKFEENLEFDLSKTPSFTLSVIDFDQVYEFLETIKSLKGIE